MSETVIAVDNLSKRYLVEHKPKGSVVLVDEAYIHFSDATSALDLVKADKDVVVLRTFSKIYGMAGLRCGLATGRPDLIERVASYSGWNSLPVTGQSSWARKAAMGATRSADISGGAGSRPAIRVSAPGAMQFTLMSCASG